MEARQLQLCLVPIGRRRFSITLPDGGLYRFGARNAQECSPFQAPQPDSQFTPVPGPTGGATAGRISAGGQLRALDGALVLVQGGMLVDSDTGLPWNPLDFELTTEEGFRYRLREGIGIVSVTDPYGNAVSYGAKGYQHSAALSVATTAADVATVEQVADLLHGKEQQVCADSGYRGALCGTQSAVVRRRQAERHCQTG